MTTEPTAELLAYGSDLAKLHDLVVGDAIIARTLDVDPAARDAIAVVVPDGWRAEVLDPARHEHLLPSPRRAAGTVRFADPGGFADYWNRHNGITSTLWADPEQPLAVAVFNDHEPRFDSLHIAGDPESNDRGTHVAGWGDHRARLELRPTADWQALQALASGEWTGQATFAERLEDVADLVTSHKGADLLTLVNNLTATSTRKVVTTDLTGASSAVTFEAAQSVKAAGGLEIPTALIVTVRPYRFLDFAPSLKVRVRVRVHSDALQLRAELVHPDVIAEATLDALAAELARLGVPAPWVGVPR